MRLIDADDILGYGFAEWLACVLCGQATNEHPSCDGACDTQARLYADKAADALVSWLAEVPTIEAEPVRHGHWIKDIEKNSVGCSECHTWFPLDSVGYIEDYDPVKDLCLHYCSWCGAKMDEVAG